MTATCANLSTGAWSPVLITVPAADGLDQPDHQSHQQPPGPDVDHHRGPVGRRAGNGGNHQRPSPDHSNAQGAATWPIPGDPGSSGITPPSQGPRVRSFSTEVGPGATVALPPWATLRPGTYLIESGTHPSIQGPMGLYGILVVTTAPAGTTAGTAYPAVGTSAAITYNAEVPLVFGEIDAVQNNAVNTAVNTAGFSETMVWSGLPGGCGDPASPTYHQCYPPAVNYTPLYYTINGVAFNKTSAASSVFAATPRHQRQLLSRAPYWCAW